MRPFSIDGVWLKLGLRIPSGSTYRTRVFTHWRLSKMEPYGHGAERFRTTRAQLGNGNRTTMSSPVRVGALAWSRISGGGNHALGIRSDGTLWSWGYNQYGELGVTGTAFSSPVQVGSLTNWVDVSAGTSHSAALNSDGKIYIWGYYLGGRLGQDTISANISSPVLLGSGTNWAVVRAGKLSTFALKTPT